MVASSNDIEGERIVGSHDEPDERGDHLLAHLGPHASGEMPQTGKSVAELAAKREAESFEVASDGRKRRPIEFKNNILEGAFLERIAIEPDPAVGEGLAFVFHGNTFRAGLADSTMTEAGGVRNAPGGGGA